VSHGPFRDPGQFLKRCIQALCNRRRSVYGEAHHMENDLRQRLRDPLHRPSAELTAFPLLPAEDLS
jgi:hypothetical protein